MDGQLASSMDNEAAQLSSARESECARRMEAE